MKNEFTVIPPPPTDEYRPDTNANSPSDDLMGGAGAHAPLRPRCKATNKFGRRCGNAAILGGTVCRNHGGAAPQVLKAARERLEQAAPLAADALVSGLKTGPTCPVCGRSDNQSNVLRAAQLILDRVGLGPSATVTVEHSDTDEDTALLMQFIPTERLEKMSAWMEEATEAMVRAQRPLPVIDITPIEQE